MDRRLLFPLMAVTASAQQLTPEAAAAEAALRARVEQFYQLQVDKKFRAADAFVAEDTKDFYFASQKADIQGITIQKVQLLDSNTRAKITVRTKSTMMMMGVGRMPIEMPSVLTWKLENGQWMWYFDANAPVDTPFGPMKPKAVSAAEAGGAAPAFPSVKDLNIENFMKQVTINRTNVTLSEEGKAETVVISNAMPGFVDVTFENKVPGLKVEIDNPHVQAGGSATLKLVRSGTGNVAGVLSVTVLPLNTIFDIIIRSGK